MLALGAAPAAAQQGSTAADRDRQTRGDARDDKAREATSSTGEKITDAWILTKVKAQFVGEDALEHSDINVDVRNHVVFLKGTVASQAGQGTRGRDRTCHRRRDRVENDLRIGVAADTASNRDSTLAHADADARATGHDTKDAAHDAKKSTKEAAKDTKNATEDAAADVREEAAKHITTRTRAHTTSSTTPRTRRRTSRTTRSEATGTAGQAVSDGWITTKVKSSFVGVEALDGSDINVDTNDHVVTLRGTVPSAAARAEGDQPGEAGGGRPVGEGRPDDRREEVGRTGIGGWGWRRGQLRPPPGRLITPAHSATTTRIGSASPPQSHPTKPHTSPRPPRSCDNLPRMSDLSSYRISWIGTGVMGLSMCGHLLDRGAHVIGVHRARREGPGRCSSAEPAWASAPRRAAEQSDVVVHDGGLSRRRAGGLLRRRRRARRRARGAPSSWT